VLNILLREKEKISKWSFIISLFDKISKNPSFIIYVDLRITTLTTESIAYRVKREICFKNREYI